MPYKGTRVRHPKHENIWWRQLDENDTEPHGPFEVTFRDSRKASRKKCGFDGITKALLYRDSVSVEKGTGGTVTVPIKTTFAQYARDYLENGSDLNAERSNETYERHVDWAIEYFGEKAQLAKITGTDMSHFLKWLRGQNLSEGYQAQIVATVNRIFKHAISYKATTGIKNNPISDVPEKEKPKRKSDTIEPEVILTLEETARVTSYRADSRHGFRNQMVAQVFLLTGVRIGELCGLSWENIDFDNLRLRVVGQAARRNAEPNVPVKGRREFGRARSIVISQDLADSLHQLKKQQGEFVPLTAPVFRSDRNLPICRRTAALIWKQQLIGAGVTRSGINPHKARHTYASILLALDTPNTAVKEMLGHAHLQTTNMYSHFSENEKTTQTIQTALSGLLKAHPAH